jgi:hypothetical protein
LGERRAAIRIDYGDLAAFGVWLCLGSSEAPPERLARWKQISAGES